MTAPNPHARAADAAYRAAARWVRDNHPDVWAEIHETERRRRGLSRRALNVGPRRPAPTTTTGRSQ